MKLKRIYQHCIAASAALAFIAAPAAFATPIGTTTTTLSITAGGSGVSTVSDGTVVTLTATVSSSGTPVVSGVVDFCDATAHCTDVNLLGKAQLTTGGIAVFKFRPGPGSHNYKAIFVGTSSYARSVSIDAALTVTPPSAYPTAATLTSSGSAGNYTLSAVVGGNGPLAPSGTLSFLDTTDSDDVVTTAPLIAGTNLFSFATDAFSASASESVTADWNGDGIADLATFSGETVYILKGNGDGTFELAQSLSAPYQITAITTADFNGDGIPDLALTVNVVIDHEGDVGPGEVITYLGKGDGTFTQVTTTAATGVSPYSMISADFNEDGVADIATVNQDGSLTVLIGAGSGMFTSIPNAEYSGPNMVNDQFYNTFSITAGDFNADGIADLAIVNPVTDTVAILLGVGDGTFTTGPALTASSPSYSVASADFNGDGILDLAVLSATNSTMSIYLGSGGGNFTAKAQAVNPSGFSFAIADINADGDPDVITASSNGALNIYLGDGEGDFTAASIAGVIPTTVNRASISMADFNGDGVPDIAGYSNVFLTQTQSSTATATGVAVLPAGSGTHNVEASFAAEGDYAATVSGTVALTAVQGTPSINLQLSAGTVTYGTSVTFTATVSGAGLTPTGQVSFDDGTTYLGVGTLINGVATFSTSTLAIGPHSITARYLGDANYTTVTSLASSLTVNGAPKPSTVSVTPSYTNISTLQAITVQVVVGGGSGNPIPTGSVTLAGGGYSGSATLSGGSATFSIPAGALAVTTNTLTATYAGVAPYSGNSGTAAVTVVTAVPATMTSPAQGASFSGSSVTFNWTTATDAQGYYMRIGTTGPGSSDLYYSAMKTGTSYTFTGMPTNGKTIYVYLVTNFYGTWRGNDYTYTAGNAAAMTSPAQGATFTSQSATFNWTTIPGATGYYLWIGTTGVGSSNLYYSALKTGTSYTFGGMPINGETIYVRLITNLSGTWVSNDYTYTAATKGVSIASPAQGSTFSSSSVTFTWPNNNGATSYYLWIGSTGVGSSNLYYSAPKTVTSYTFNNMPTNGETIYVRLTTNYNGTWVYNDYTYTASSPATLTAPTAGSTFSGASVTFDWTAQAGATGYYLWIGTTGAGSSNLYYSAEKTGTSYTFAKMPTNGETIYVRLITNYNGNWSYNDYTYKAAPSQP